MEKNDLLPLEESKEQLIAKIKGTIRHKEEKMNKETGNELHSKSKEALEKLALHVEDLPTTNQIFDVYRKMDDNGEKEAFNHELSLFGYDRDPDPERFVKWLVDKFTV